MRLRPAELKAMCTAEAFLDQEVQPAVRGFLHRPENPNRDGLVLSHGAGSNANAPLLIALAEAFCSAGFHVLRCDLPFRQSKPSGPPMGTAALDQAGIKNAVLAMKTLASGRVFVGGHSYGGRQSSMLCAVEPDVARGLLLLSYPLHPPRKPEQLRTQHFPKLQTPALFVHGTRDPFGTVDELQRATGLVPAVTGLIAVEGAGHDLGFTRKARTSGLPASVVDNFTKFIDRNR
jgi:uncharacterized protein